MVSHCMVAHGTVCILCTCLWPTCIHMVWSPYLHNYELQKCWWPGGHKHILLFAFMKCCMGMWCNLVVKSIYNVIVLASDAWKATVIVLHGLLPQHHIRYYKSNCWMWFVIESLFLSSMLYLFCSVIVISFLLLFCMTTCFNSILLNGFLLYACLWSPQVKVIWFWIWEVLFLS